MTQATEPITNDFYHRWKDTLKELKKLEALNAEMLEALGWVNETLQLRPEDLWDEEGFPTEESGRLTNTIIYIIRKAKGE